MRTSVPVSRLRKRLFIGFGLIVVASILTPPTKSPKADLPLLTGAQIDPKVMAILERSCQDCHSEKTHYPWYSYVAPFSWLVENDVAGGLVRMNLSEWEKYPVARRDRLLSEIGEQVKNRDMPVTQYLWIHRNARLSDDEVQAVFDWTQKERARLIAESPH
jgi:hypothetical protein